MPRPLRVFVRIVEGFNRFVGRIAMYLIFVLIGILLWSSISKAVFVPSLWTLEMAQFTMVAYYIIGGPYSIQLGSNVRMDLFYGGWSDRQKAWFDAFTVLFLMFFLVTMFIGGVSSTAYSLGHYGTEPFAFFKDLFVGFVTGGMTGAEEVLGRLERSPTAWRPYLWPIKAVICIGLILMILQALVELVKDIARIRGEEI
ncbi:TRAP transporter small permease subunit [Aliiroseovarius sp. YM-037]|uniref:TRAP transporter small permease subunit n=1 Tax=Aliiroseovarius sp. YM-037 TaxID=3341728 RepID=UPI003A811631